jgi:hypothetical protein
MTWTIDGFQTMVALWAWSTILLLHGFYRSVYHPEPDPVRPPGPVD